MSEIYEVLSPGGHEAMATSIFTYIKNYIDTHGPGSKVDRAGDTMTGALNMAGQDICLKTSGSSSNDSGDIVFFYGNGQEKSRIWTDTTYTTIVGPKYRVYKEDGTSLYSGNLAIHNKSDHLAPISNGTRLASADQQGAYNASLFTFLATSSMTTSKPPADGHIIHSCWDNNGGWDTQLFLRNGDAAIYTRAQSNGTWTAWKQVAFYSDIAWGNVSGKPSSYTPSSHTHTSLELAGSNTSGTSSSTFATGAFNVRWYSQTGKIPGQPNQYGFMMTLATGTGANENHNIWVSQADGDILHRGTNSSSAASPPAFKTLLDSGNYGNYATKTDGSNISRLAFAKALTNQAVSSPGYVVGLTDSWGSFGYTTIAQLRTKLGISGIYSNQDSNQTLTAGTAKAGAALSLPAGNYVITYTGTFPAGGTTSIYSCGCVVSTTSGGTSPINGQGLTNAKYINDNEARVSGATIANFGSETKVYCNLWIRGASGKTLSGCWAQIRAIRISV